MKFYKMNELLFLLLLYLTRSCPNNSKLRFMLCSSCCFCFFSVASISKYDRFFDTYVGHLFSFFAKKMCLRLQQENKNVKLYFEKKLI